MRSIGIVFFLTIISVSLFSQSWNQVDSRSIRQLGERNINPDRFITAYVNDEEIKDILWSAPQELSFNPKTDSHTLINIMGADGNMEEFSIVQYQMMEPGLAKRYSYIRTFHGLSTTNSARRIRINYTLHGLRAVITDENGQTYIDHFQRKDKNHKIIYRRSDFSANEDWACEFKQEKFGHNDKKGGNSRSGDCVFRSYRFSMTATGEYSNYHDAFSEADSGLVMSAIVTTVDRINDVYEQDLTMRLILIDSVDNVWYYDPITDPFSGSSAGSMISQNQTNTDSLIGSANYDLGHIVSTGGSGLASLGVLCTTGLKARGVTGISTPEGDPFDIDFVAHEVGHQLGGNHTQNNDCQRNDPTAVEPGSASTIMGYAGICAPNVQNNSDAYLHAISIQEMNLEMTSNSCEGVITLNNSAPVANPLTTKSIPHSTPFVLDVVATDSDVGDVLTYNWEQMDTAIGAVMPPAGTNPQGPLFRSKFATTDSKRYFPNLTSLTSNSTDIWEVLPIVSRNMDFRVTVRDNSFAPGCTDEQDITLAVVGTAGPFLVTSQDTATTWKEIETFTITWDVANTDVAPVSCSNVDILLSYDGGLTYPTILASATLNDGSEIINVPIGTTTTGRIMVKCSDNVFFDINDADITINPGTPSFSINTNPQSGSACDGTMLFTLESTSILGFMDPIALSVTGLPPGASASITTNPITPGNNTTIAIDEFGGQSGDFNIKVTGVAADTTKEAYFLFTVENLDVVPELLSPASGSTGALTDLTLNWSNTPGAINYEYQVSTLPAGGDIVSSGFSSTESVVVSPELDQITTYYWRIRSTISCGTTLWSEEWTFETGNCVIKSANDLPIIISSIGTPTITSSLFFKDKGVVTDLNIINLTGTHSYISDLNFTLMAPDETSLPFWEDPCNEQQNFDINFDDKAVSANHPCPPTDGLTYKPDSPLSAFDTKQLKGKWTLSVFDDFDADGGSLDSWGVEICLDGYCDLTVDNNMYINTYGTLLSAIECAVDGDTIFLETTIADSTINMGSESIIINHNIVIVAALGDSIKVLSTGSLPTFTINPDKIVSLVGFDIENTVTTAGVLVNNGTLILKDMDVTSGIGLKSIVNGSDAFIEFNGNCSVFEN